MARRQGPQLPSLIYDKAFEADGVMRPEAADSHQGQGREQSRNRLDRFVHSTPPTPKVRLAREASIDCHKCRAGARRQRRGMRDCGRRTASRVSAGDRPARRTPGCSSTSYGHLQLGALIADNRPVLGPVELERLAGFKCQRHECPATRHLQFSLASGSPIPCECRNPIV